jgi:hypothetical protein
MTFKLARTVDVLTFKFRGHLQIPVSRLPNPQPMTRCILDATLAQFFNTLPDNHFGFQFDSLHHQLKPLFLYCMFEHTVCVFDEIQVWSLAYIQDESHLQTLHLILSLV